MGTVTVKRNDDYRYAWVVIIKDAGEIRRDYYLTRSDAQAAARVWRKKLARQAHTEQS